MLLNCTKFFLLPLAVLLWGFKPVKAKVHLTDSLERELTKSGPNHHRVKVLLKLVDAYAGEKADTAIKRAKEAISLSEKLDFDVGRADAHFALGRVYRQRGVYGKAMKSLTSALNIYQKLDHYEGQANSHKNIGWVHYRQENYDFAIENLKRAIEIFDANGERSEAAKAAANLGAVYNKAGRYEEGMQNLEGALEVFQTTRNARMEANTLNNMGQGHFRKEDYETALTFYLKSLERKQEIGFPKGSIGNTMTNVAKTLNKLGRYDEAEKYLTEAEKIARTSGQDNLPDVYEELSNMNEGLGLWKMALKYHKRFKAVYDSIFNRDQTKLIYAIQADHDLDQKEKAIELLNKDKALQNSNLQRQQATIIGLLLILVLAAGLGVVLLRSNRARKKANQMLQRKNEQITHQQEEILMRNEELARKNEKLEDLNREKDGLISVVAHDIKAPLARTVGFTQLIALSGELNDEQKQYISLIEKTNQDAGSMIRDLLDINSIEHSSSNIELTEFNLNQFLKNSVTGFRPSAKKKKIDLHGPIMDEEVKVISDEKFLNRILDNLVSNAIKFSPKERNIYISAIRENNHVNISVKDEGPGISKEDQKKMFKKFQKLSAKPTGGESSTGLGLSIIKALIQKLQGDIRVESELGQGAEFIVTIPLSES